MKITYMVFQMPQILIHYEFVFQKHKHGHNSSKYCLSLPSCLKNSALLTEALSAVRSSSSELHVVLLVIKERKKCSGGAIQIYSDSYRNTGQSEKFKVSYIFHSPPET